MPSLTMSQQQTKPANFKRMKQLFLIFLKQFEMDEYKLLIQFLQLIINKYNLNPSKLFGFLTSTNEQEEISLNDVVAAATQVKKTLTNTNTATTSSSTNVKQNTQSNTENNSNQNDSSFRRSLRINSAKLASNFNKNKSNLTKFNQTIIVYLKIYY